MYVSFIFHSMHQNSTNVIGLSHIEQVVFIAHGDQLHKSAKMINKCTNSDLFLKI